MIVKMRKSKILLAVFMGLVTLAMVSSCNKENANSYKEEYFILDGIKYKKASDETLNKLLNNRIYLDCSKERTYTCLWADGQYGSINCDGGSCSVLETQNPDYSWSACIGCYKNNVISHAGACRPVQHD
jgi:hypothetical protein